MVANMRRTATDGFRLILAGRLGVGFLRAIGHFARFRVGGGLAVEMGIQRARAAASA